MSKNNLVKNGLAVFEHPIQFEGTNVYGFLYNKEEELKNRNDGNPISHYIGYLFGTSQLYKVGGYIHPKTKEWRIPAYNLKGKSDNGLNLFVALLMDGLLNYKTYEFDTPIQIEENEVDKDVDELIINKSLIDRYVKDIHNN